MANAEGDHHAKRRLLRARRTGDVGSETIKAGLLDPPNMIVAIKRDGQGPVFASGLR